MANYRPPDVTVVVQPNPRIINLGEALRVPAIVGMGPSILTVTDEAVVRGTGSVDYLAAYPGSTITILQVAKRSGLLAGALDYATGSSGSLYPTGSLGYTPAVDGSITWNTSPTAGTVYYVTYTRPVSSANYDPTFHTDKNTLTAMYGQEDNVTGILTIAGSIALENGAPAVMIVQTASATFNEQSYFDAIDKLKKKEGIEDVIVVFPTGSSGSPSRTDQDAVIAYAYQHVQNMSQPSVKKERGLGTGSPPLQYAPGGFDTIGDISVTNSYVGRANILKSKNVFYAVPSTITRLTPGGVRVQLDGNFGAVAVAGKRAAQPKRSTPMHGFTLIGIDIDEEKWNDAEMDFLGAGGCLVLQKRGGIISIRDSITTDGTSADTQELSIPASERLVKRSLRTAIRDIYLNKGLVITDDVLSDIEGTIQTTLTALVRQGELEKFGTKSDPTTGEVPIRAQRDPIEPRRVVATCSIKYAYALRYIDITVYPFV